jgi:hypothetical protein
MALLNYNVTIDPAAAASAVTDPEIEAVIDLISGDILDSTRFITSHRYDAFVEKRGWVLEAMKADKPLFACALCGTPVYLVASPEKRFFFRHRVEDGSCPAQTRSSLTQSEIRARKYHGLRESEAHKRIKRLIERSLAADLRFQTESIVQERRWRSQSNPNQWRQPDVQATCSSDRLAFGAQLSTTFLDVVVERRSFYRGDGALLIWIVGQFNPSDRRLMIDDLLFSNNSNILVVDEERTRISEERREFHLRCHYWRVWREGDRVLETWDQQTASFHKLIRNVEEQQTYLFDSKGEKERLAVEIDQELRAGFLDLWNSINFPYDTRPEILDVWEIIRAKLAARSITIPEKPHTDSAFQALMHGLLSAQKGVPVGWRFKGLIEVAHHLAEDYPQHLLAFAYALEHYGNKVILEFQDTSGKWKIKRDSFRSGIKLRDPAYIPDHGSRAVLAFYFRRSGAD